MAWRSLFIIFILVASNTGNASAGHWLPSKKECIHLLRPSPLPMARTENELDFNSGNTSLLLNVLRSKGDLELTRSPFVSIRGVDKLCVPGSKSCFIIVQTKPRTSVGGRLLILKGADGKWFSVPTTRPLLRQNSLIVDFSKFKYVPSEEPDLSAELTKIRARLHQEVLKEKSAEELGDSLAVKQLSNSSNFKRTAPEEKVLFAKSVRQANRELAELLRINGKISSEILSEVNAAANAGIHPYGKVENDRYAGVVRGTSTSELDMTDFNVKQGAADGATLNTFLLARDVPESLRRWIEKVNVLSFHSDPIEVFALYKEFIDIHPFADGNGRTARMILNFMLLKIDLMPLDFPAESLFYRPEDILRKYVQSFEGSIPSFPQRTLAGINLFKLNSFKDLESLSNLAEDVRKTLHFEKVTIEHLHGTSGYIFVATYKGRFIQSESTRSGEELSDSLGVMLSRSMRTIDDQAWMANALGLKSPSYAIYPELLEQSKNYHVLYEKNYLRRKFILEKKKVLSAEDESQLNRDSFRRYEEINENSQLAKSDREFLDIVMATPKTPFTPAKSVEEVAEEILSITSPEFKDKIRKAMISTSTSDMKTSLIEIYNAFNSPRFDSFMTDLALQALKLCREAGDCTPQQRSGIPDKYLALVLKQSAENLGIPVETISRYAGREPGRLYLERIRRGSLIFDDGAPGNHGMMPHAIQNLFIHQELGKDRALSFFRELTGWVYERMFDSNAAFTPIPSTRDITRRHYWTGVLKAGNRSEISKLGDISSEKGRYPEFLREQKLDLVGVEENTKGLLNDGSLVRTTFEGHEFQFLINKEGVPEPSALEKLNTFKSLLPLNR